MSNEVNNKENLRDVSAPVMDAKATLIDYNTQISELRTMIQSMAETFEASQRRVAQDIALSDLANEVRQTARSMATSAVSTLPIPQATATSRGCDGSECGCTSSNCCTFEIILDKVRASRPQKLIEIADSGDTALPVPTINAMEVQIYVTVDNIGVLIPGLATTMDLRASGGLNPGPGPWVVVNRVVNRVQVPKGITKVFNVATEVREHDEGVERPIGFKDELGEATGSIALNCCMDEIYPPMPIDVELVHGGEGGGTVQIAFYAKRVCC